MKYLYIILLILALMIFIGWLGLQFKPAPFPPYDAQQFETKTVPMPDNLPLPVERFYRAVYGGNIPVIESAVFQGRACQIGTSTMEFCYTGKDDDGRPVERMLHAHSRSCAAIFLRGLVRRGAILYPEDWDLEIRKA